MICHIIGGNMKLFKYCCQVLKTSKFMFEMLKIETHDRSQKEKVKKCISAKKKKMYCLQERHEFEIKIRVRKKLQ